MRCVVSAWLRFLHLCKSTSQIKHCSTLKTGTYWRNGRSYLSYLISNVPLHMFFFSWFRQSRRIIVLFSSSVSSSGSYTLPTSLKSSTSVSWSKPQPLTKSVQKKPRVRLKISSAGVYRCAPRSKGAAGSNASHIFNPLPIVVSSVHIEDKLCAHNYFFHFCNQLLFLSHRHRESHKLHGHGLLKRPLESTGY